MPQLADSITALASAAELCNPASPLRSHRQSLSTVSAVVYRRANFVPVDVGCLHRFAIFTNYTSCRLDAENKEILAQVYPQ